MKTSHWQLHHHQHKLPARNHKKRARKKTYPRTVSPAFRRWPRWDRVWNCWSLTPRSLILATYTSTSKCCKHTSVKFLSLYKGTGSLIIPLLIQPPKLYTSCHTVTTKMILHSDGQWCEPPLHSTMSCCGNWSHQKVPNTSQLVKWKVNGDWFKPASVCFLAQHLQPNSNNKWNLLITYPPVPYDGEMQSGLQQH